MAELYYNGNHFENDMLRVLLKKAKVPATLVNIDKVNGTNFTKTLLDKNGAADYEIHKEADSIVGITFPGERFLDDDSVEDLASLISEKVGSNVEARAGHQFAIPLDVEESLFSDLFRKEVVLTRSPFGGYDFNVQMLRLTCTNGASVPQKGFYKHLSANVVLDSDDVLEAIKKFSINSCLEGMFTINGEVVNATYGDVLNLSKFVEYKSLGESRIGRFHDMLVNKFDEANVAVSSLSPQERSFVNVGVPLYNVFNMATADLRSASLLLEDKIGLSRLIKPRKKIRTIPNVEVRLEEDKLHELMGDM